MKIITEYRKKGGKKEVKKKKKSNLFLKSGILMKKLARILESTILLELNDEK